MKKYLLMLVALGTILLAADWSKDDVLNQVIDRSNITNHEYLTQLDIQEEYRKTAIMIYGTKVNKDKALACYLATIGLVVKSNSKLNAHKDFKFKSANEISNFIAIHCMSGAYEEKTEALLRYTADVLDNLLAGKPKKKEKKK